MAGIRQGASLWLAKSSKGTDADFRYPIGQHFTWNKEAFVRFAVTKAWWGEVGLQHYSFSSKALDSATMIQSVKTDYLQLNLNAQYDVSYPVLGYLVPYFFKMRSYLGLSFSPRLAFAKSTTLSGAVSQTTTPSVLAGVSYSHLLPISDRFWAYSSFSYRALVVSRQVGEGRDITYPNRAISWMGGVCYTLK